MRKSSVFILLFFAVNLLTVITLASLSRIESARYQEYVPQNNGVIVFHQDQTKETLQHVVANPFKMKSVL